MYALSRILRQESQSPGVSGHWRFLGALYTSHNRQQLLEARAHHYRFNPTCSEALLWSAIRGKRLGVQFRRQQVLGNFIVDFLSRKERLVVEVDGDVYHDTRVTLDAARERKLARMGYRVVRVPASLVTRDIEQTVAVVALSLAALAKESR